MVVSVILGGYWLGLKFLRYVQTDNSGVVDDNGSKVVVSLWFLEVLILSCLNKGVVAGVTEIAPVSYDTVRYLLLGIEEDASGTHGEK